MPELPEVETIRRQLQANIVGQTIKSVQVLYSKVVQGIGVKKFEHDLAGKKIKEIGRRGKLILIRLAGDKTLVVHLKMTGRLLLVKKGTAPEKHTGVVFVFKSGKQLFYDDMRRFGFVKIMDEAKLKLGIDFFDQSMGLKKFKELVGSRSGSQIKPLLMDQSLIAGIGNIYAQEACFAAKVNPLRKVSSLSDKELGGLYKGLSVVMKSAIKAGGSSVDAGYRDAFSRQGRFSSFLKVYGRAGKACLRCKAKLVKKSIGGRGTVFCGKCQK